MNPLDPSQMLPPALLPPRCSDFQPRTFSVQSEKVGADGFVFAGCAGCQLCGPERRFNATLQTRGDWALLLVDAIREFSTHHGTSVEAFLDHWKLK